MQRFPEKLRTLRTKRRLTQQQLADDFGFTHTFVYKLESGKSKPNAELILKLARYFGVTPDQLMLDEVELEE